jgi:hypothetical protein
MGAAEIAAALIPEITPVADRESASYLVKTGS